MHPMAQRLIDEYLEAASHRDDQKGPLFRPVKNNIIGTLLKPLDPHTEKAGPRKVRRLG